MRFTIPLGLGLGSMLGAKTLVQGCHSPALGLLSTVAIALGTATGAAAMSSRKMNSAGNGDSNQPEDPTCHRDWDVRLRVVEIVDNVINPPGAFGDVQIFRDTILDGPPGEGSVVGFDEGTCLYTVAQEEQKCDFTFVFTEGGNNVTSINVIGHFAAPTPNLAVVGGTGDYTGANGYVVVTQLNDTSTGEHVWNYDMYFDVLECC